MDPIEALGAIEGVDPGLLAAFEATAEVAVDAVAAAVPSPPPPPTPPVVLVPDDESGAMGRTRGALAAVLVAVATASHLSLSRRA